MGNPRAGLRIALHANNDPPNGAGAMIDSRQLCPTPLDEGAIGDGSHDDSDGVERALARTPQGGTCIIPPLPFLCTRSILVPRYINIEGLHNLPGYQTGPELLFDDCDGLSFPLDYARVQNLGIRFVGTQQVINPATGSFGYRGLISPDSVGAVFLRVTDVNLYGFDTNIYLGVGGVYHEFTRVNSFSGQIGVAFVNVATWAAFQQVIVRNNTLHGLYADASFVDFNQCEWEGNGYQGGDLSNADYVKYGLWQKGSGHYRHRGGWINDTVFTEDPAVFELERFTHESGIRLYGSGYQIIENRETSPNLLPMDIARRWTPTAGLTVADGTNGEESHLTANAGTDLNVIFQDYLLTRSIAVQDIDMALLSFDAKVVTGDGDPDFTLIPNITFRQISGRQDSVNVDLMRPPAVWPRTIWADNAYHRMSFVMMPRYGALYLDAAEFNIDYIQIMLALHSGNFAVNHLDAYIRNVSLQLYTRRPIGERVLTRPFAPADASGAGLVMAASIGYYEMRDGRVKLDFSVLYPATADASVAKLSLPVAAAPATGTEVGGGYIAGYTDAGADLYFSITGGTASVSLRDNTGTSRTNAQLSGKSVRGVLDYRVQGR